MRGALIAVALSLVSGVVVTAGLVSYSLAGSCANPYIFDLNCDERVDQADQQLLAAHVGEFFDGTAWVTATNTPTRTPTPTQTKTSTPTTPGYTVTFVITGTPPTAFRMQVTTNAPGDVRVQFLVDGGASPWAIENNAPYSLCGDNGVVLNQCALSPGQHTIVANVMPQGATNILATGSIVIGGPVTPTNTPLPPTPTFTRTNTPTPGPVTPTFTPVAGTRSKLAWPFASTSIWNMPIGANASYVWGDVNIKDGFFAIENAMPIMAPSAPLRPLYHVAHWWPISCTETSGNVKQVPIPDGYVVGNAGSLGDGTLPNRPGGVLLSDGVTIQEFQYAVRCSGTGPLVAGSGDRCQHSIYGSGQCSYGAQGGSGLSGVGGVLRTWEVVTSDPIRHALKVTIPAEELSNCNGGYRWPAVAADGYHNSAYTGSICALRMGSLVALSPSYNCAQHSGLGARVCQALKDYGAYVGDTHNGWSPGTIIGEVNTGTALASVGDQIVTLLRNLYVIDNNTSGNIGGGGAPRVPLAPPIGD